MGNHVREVTTEEKIKHAEQRINELNLLINYWRVQSEKERKTIGGIEGPTSGTKSGMGASRT